MSDSRESSPDWLRSFQVPSHTQLKLSSDSESLHDDSPSTGNKTGEGSSPESPIDPEVNKSKSKGLSKSRAKSSSRETIEATTLKIQDQTSSRRKKLGKQKAERDWEEKKIADDSNDDNHRGIKNLFIQFGHYHQILRQAVIIAQKEKIILI